MANNLKEKIIKLRLEGMTYNDIAKELKCSKSTISYHLNSNTEAKVSKKKRRYDEPAGFLDAIQAHKEKFGCADCQTMYPHYVLEFDHRPEFKKIANVYRVYKKYGEDRAWQEVAKCDIVCSNCHKIRTWERNNINYES
jgi:DNA-binding Lrp family transcriptional regulator